jgi:serine/threonine protein kinase
MMDMAFNYHPLSRFVEKKRATLSLTAKIYILISMAQSLRFLKIREIVHMDFNPRNILISENYSCKLIDFGESYHRKLCS